MEAWRYLSFPRSTSVHVALSSGYILRQAKQVSVCVPVGDNVISPHLSPMLEACVPETQQLLSLLWSQFLHLENGTKTPKLIGCYG